MLHFLFKFSLKTDMQDQGDSPLVDVEDKVRVALAL